MEFVNTEKIGRIALVEFSREDGINALSPQLMEELRDTARNLADDAESSAVVLHGKGVFSAGADLKETFIPAHSKQSKLEIRTILKLGPDLCDAWENIEAYTVGAIEKFCIGGASALTSALDYRIMGRSAHMRLPEVALGLNMSWHTIPRLVAQIGPARTKQYITLCEAVSADTALSWGLCEEIADDGATLAAAMAFAEKIAALPPLPVRMTKQTVNAISGALAASLIQMDRDQVLLSFLTEDFQEAMSAYLEKRKPAFTGN